MHVFDENWKNFKKCIEKGYDMNKVKCFKLFPSKKSTFPKFNVICIYLKLFSSDFLSHTPTLPEGAKKAYNILELDTLFPKIGGVVNP